MKPPRTCVSGGGRFLVGVHRPEFTVKNLRDREYPGVLGRLRNGDDVDNAVNFPLQDLHEPGADVIYEIPNAFPFRGTTFINTAWADAKAASPETIRIPAPRPCSYLESAAALPGSEKIGKAGLINLLPRPLQIALAQTSTDPEELILLAEKSCWILFDPDTREPAGIGYRQTPGGRAIPDIRDRELFEVLVNNRFLPDTYKNALVLKPGVQGNNEITGEYRSGDGRTHVFEYLRRNSYIPWGHFASNMANDAIRYRARDLSEADMTGIRHLYYQRAFVRLARQIGVPEPGKRACMTPEALENLRFEILDRLSSPAPLLFDRSLWGWNYGFECAASGHRLHASHQMIHQQNAMIPKTVAADSGSPLPAFACGDLVRDFVALYRQAHGRGFFSDYLDAIRNNTRTDGNPGGAQRLIVHEDAHVILFVPKAQICEWELQLIPKKPVGNILEADTATRASLDTGILSAVKALDHMGARMVTAIEFSKPFDDPGPDQHLLYSFIPRLPYAPDTFSEAQLRFISGAYPEDVAAACRNAMAQFALKGGRP